jgi:serine protease
MGLRRRRGLALFSVVAAALLCAGAGEGWLLRLQVRPAFVPPADAPEFAPDRVVVKFAGDVTPEQIDAAFAPLGARWIHRGVDDAFDVLEVETGTVLDWVVRLSALPGVEYAEPDYVAWAAASDPDDPYFDPYQWNFFDWGRLSNGYASNFGVQGSKAWNVTQGAGVTVAIVDTGVAYEDYGSFYQAPDLAGQSFVSPKDYVNSDDHANDDNGHGTHVCGTVAQATNNALGVTGLAYACTIMPVKVLSSSGSGYHSWIADGIRWAYNNGAKVINLSLGSSSGSSTLKNAVDDAWNAGCVLCAATGNSGGSRISYPARYDNCMAVGATRFDGKRCTYSQWGTGIDVVAPGGDVRVDQNKDGYGDGILQQTFSGGYGNFSYWFFEGTSMATPHASAVAAMVFASHSSYTNADVRTAIQSTTKDLGAAGYDTKFGHGLVNADGAVNY